MNGNKPTRITAYTDIPEFFEFIGLEQIEVRTGFGGHETFGAYFNDLNALARSIETLDKSNTPRTGIYFTRNNVADDTLFQNEFPVKRLYNLTSKEDIPAENTIVIDVDPKKKKGQQNVSQAFTTQHVWPLANSIGKLLNKNKIKHALVATGNGFQIVIPILPKPASEKIEARVGDIFTGLNDQLENDYVKIDTTIKARNKVVKMPATQARKGPENEWSMTQALLHDGEVSDFDSVEKILKEAYPIDEKKEEKRIADMPKQHKAVKVDTENGTVEPAFHRTWIQRAYINNPKRFFKDFNFNLTTGTPTADSRTDCDDIKYHIVCPNDPEHNGTDCYVAFDSYGYPSYLKCSHTSCEDLNLGTMVERLKIGNLLRSETNTAIETFADMKGKKVDKKIRRDQYDLCVDLIVRHTTKDVGLFTKDLIEAAKNNKAVSVADAKTALYEAKVEWKRKHALVDISDVGSKRVVLYNDSDETTTIDYRGKEALNTLLIDNEGNQRHFRRRDSIVSVDWSLESDDFGNDIRTLKISDFRNDRYYESMRSRLDSLVVWKRANRDKTDYETRESTSVDICRWACSSEPDKSSFPTLLNIASYPILVRSNDSYRLLAEDGYDTDSKYYVGTNLSLRKMEVDEAVQIINGVFSSFPFDSPAGLAASVALMFAPIIKPAILTGEFPLFVATAGQHGAGKSYLQRLALSVVVGKIVEEYDGLKASKEEFDKTLESKLIAGDPTFLLDNCSNDLANDLPSIVTSLKRPVRLFHTQTSESYRNTIVYALSSKGTEFTEEMTQRSVPIKLTSPKNAKNRRFEDLLGDTLLNRSNIMSAIYTIINKWVEDGCIIEDGRHSHRAWQWAKLQGAILDVGPWGEHFLTDTKQFAKKVNTRTDSIIISLTELFNVAGADKMNNGLRLDQFMHILSDEEDEPDQLKLDDDAIISAADNREEMPVGLLKELIRGRSRKGRVGSLTSILKEYDEGFLEIENESYQFTIVKGSDNINRYYIKKEVEEKAPEQCLEQKDDMEPPF